MVTLRGSTKYLADRTHLLQEKFMLIRVPFSLAISACDVLEVSDFKTDRKDHKDQSLEMTTSTKKISASPQHFLNEPNSTSF